MGLDIKAAVMRVQGGGEMAYEVIPGYCAYWSYPGFSRFRLKIALHEGIDLGGMQGYGGDRPWGSVETDLRPLLDHSDCDGYLTSQEAGQVYPRLGEIVESWPKDSLITGDEYDLLNGRALVDLLRACHENGWDVIFS